MATKKTEEKLETSIVPASESGKSDALATLDAVTFESMTLDDFRKMAESGDWTMEKIAKLEPGQAIAGIYRGPGPVLTMKEEKLNPKTGEIYHDQVKTHRVEISGVTFCLMGSYQLDRAFEATEAGTKVAIAHKGQVQRGSRRVNDYLFMTPKKPELAQGGAQ